MAFCGHCGAELAGENVPCESCGKNTESLQFQQYPPPPPAPAPWPGPPPKDETGKIIGIVVVIIAIILAISIILPAILYVMVIGFDGGGGVEYSPAGAWSQVIAESSTSAKLTFGGFTVDISPEDIEIYIEVNGTREGFITYAGDFSDNLEEMDWIMGPMGAEAEYWDFNPQGETINSGDYIRLNGLMPDTDYSVEVFHIPSGTIISMSGDSPNFTTL